jgi:hypothetical protein
MNDFEDVIGEENTGNSKETIMDIVYNSVIHREADAIKSESPVEEKIEALNCILNFFAKREEYEKCSNIKKIINKIKC